MRISIIGWHGKKNIGDDAFLHVLKDFFLGHELEFVTPPQRCNNPDIAILGGGAVASPFYLNILPDCPRYAIGIDLAYESESDLLAKASFKEIYVRSKTDCDLLRNKVSCPVHSMPDLAFYLKPGLNWKKVGKKKLIVLVTDYVNPAIDRPIEEFQQRANNFKLKMAAELDKLSTEYEISLFPCSAGGYGDDRRINLDITSFMKTRPITYDNYLQPHSMFNVLGMFDAALCMRFHAHIFSIMCGVPFVSIEFTRKVKMFLKENDLEHLNIAHFDVDEFVVGDIQEKISEVSNQETILRFKEITENNRNQLEHIKAQVRQSWLEE